MIVIAVAMMIGFLLGMLFFGCSIFICILGIGVTVFLVLIKWKLFIFHHFSEKLLTVLKLIGILALFTLGTMTELRTMDGGIYAYEEKLDKALTLLQDNKLNKANKEIESIKKNYGASDNTVMLETLRFVGEKDYESAKTAVSGYGSKTSVDYYTLMETVYLAEGAKKNVDLLRNQYIEAAINHPEWTYVQKKAGISLIDRSEFTKAEYHLLRAYEQEPSDYQAAYYLGVSCYEQKRMNDALVYFQEAVERKADKKTMGYIAWYVEKIEQ